MPTYNARTLSISIDRPWRDVYDFTSLPENFPLWAAGLGSGLERSGEEWIATDPEGRPIRICFSRPNALGVLDHRVRFEGGREVYIAMRVVPNGTGAEVLFTLLQEPGMSDERFAADAAMVERDLEALKALLER